MKNIKLKIKNMINNKIKKQHSFTPFLLTLSFCLGIFATLLLMVGVHSVDNSLNALLFLGNDRWYVECDVIDYELNEKSEFVGSCILYPKLYILGLRLVIGGAFVLFLSGFMFALYLSKVKTKRWFRMEVRVDVFSFVLGTIVTILVFLLYIYYTKAKEYEKMIKK